MSHGFQAQSSFTWGKSIDTSSATNAGDAYGNSVPSLHWFDPRLSRGPSDFNIGKVFVLNGIWSVPGVTASGPFSWTAKGWQLSSVFKLSDGVPFTPLIGGDPLGLNSTDPWDFPNRVPGCSPVNGNYKQQRLDYVNLSCSSFLIRERYAAMPGAIALLAQDWRIWTSRCSRTTTFPESRRVSTCSFA